MKKRLNRIFFFFSSRRRHTRLTCDWSSDVCSSDLLTLPSEGDCAIAGHGDYPEPRQPGTRQERMGWYGLGHRQITARGTGRRLAMGEALTIRVRREQGYAIVAVAG